MQVHKHSDSDSSVFIALFWSGSGHEDLGNAGAGHPWNGTPDYTLILVWWQFNVDNQVFSMLWGGGRNLKNLEETHVDKRSLGSWP